MSLFQHGNFVSSAGHSLPWKVECDALTIDDWRAIAALIGSKLRFATVEGVPSGGNELAWRLKEYVTPGAGIPIIVDDVLTTGASMERQRANRLAVGVVLFARGPCPGWVYPIWQLAPWAI